MKPKKNRIYCNACGGVRILFPTKKKADNFIRFNADEIMDETGKAPVRSYYCKLCGGWHVTSSSCQDYYEAIQYAETFDLKECHKILEEMIRNLRHAFITRAYEDCYKYIEDAYMELERAEKAGFDSEEFPNVIRWLKETAGGLHRYFPKGNPKLNSSIEHLQKLKMDLLDEARSYSGDYSICKAIIENMEAEMKRAITYGASVRRLKQYVKVCESNSSPQKVELKRARKELYKQIVKQYRLKNYEECANLIRESYQNFYVSLNEGVSEDEIQSAINRLAFFKGFVENLNKANEEEESDV